MHKNTKEQKQVLTYAGSEYSYTIKHRTETNDRGESHGLNGHGEPQVVGLQQSKEHGMDSGGGSKRAYA